MKLLKDIAITYTVKLDDPIKQRNVSSTGNLNYHNSSKVPSSQIPSSHGKKNNKPPPENGNQILSPRKVEIRSPTLTIPKRQSNRNASSPTIPWDATAVCNDLNELNMIMDNNISLFRKESWAKEQHPVNPDFEGSSKSSQRKTLHSSYSRHRCANTSGPVLNLDIDLNLAEIPGPRPSPDFQKQRWNIQTKDNDDEPRARPESRVGKDSESFHRTFRKSRPLSASFVHTIISESTINQNTEWTATFTRSELKVTS